MNRKTIIRTIAIKLARLSYASREATCFYEYGCGEIVSDPSLLIEDIENRKKEFISRARDCIKSQNKRDILSFFKDIKNEISLLEEEINTTRRK